MTKEIEIVQLCLADRKTQLEEKTKELEQVQIDLSKAEFFEDMYYQLKDKRRNSEAFSRRHKDSEQLYNNLENKVNDIKTEIEMLNTEIEYIENRLK